MPNPLDRAVSDGGVEFLARAKGRKVTYTVVNATTEDRKFYDEDGSTLVFTFRYVWTDGTHTQLVSIERTA